MTLSYCKKCKAITGMGFDEALVDPAKKMKRVSMESYKLGLCLECYEKQKEVKE